MATYKNPYKGKPKTPTGVMPEDQAIRHGLVGVAFCGATDASYRKRYWKNRKVKKMFEAVKSYRQLVHGVNEPRLATTLRDAVHYLIEPMSRGNSWTANTGTQDNDNSLSAVQSPLKV
jgi:hypothetical protein